MKYALQKTEQDYLRPALKLVPKEEFLNKDGIQITLDNWFDSEPLDYQSNPLRLSRFTGAIDNTIESDSKFENKWFDLGSDMDYLEAIN